jgi:hypothetical protein
MPDRKPKRGAGQPAPLSIYNGRELLGTIAERGAFWIAHSPDGRLLARCASRREALRAIDTQGGHS